MKVLFLCDFGSPHGGAEIATIALRDGLRRRGHEALLLSSSARPSSAPLVADVLCQGTVSRWQPLLQTVNFSARAQLRKLLREFQPDVVHVSMFLLELSPLILPLLKDVPSLYHAHWLRAICPTGAKLLPDRSLCQSPAGAVCYRSGCVSLTDWPLHMAQMKMLRAWRGNLRHIVTPSEAARRMLAADGFLDIEVISNGVAEVPARAPLSDPPTAFFAGRLVKEKGIDVLLAAWTKVVRMLPSARLLIAGEGPDRPLYEKAGTAGLQFLGALDQAVVQRAAEKAWVQVIPSVCFETFPLVALESLMRGSALIASRTGGIPEIVDHRVNGLLVPPNQVEDLADALVRLLSEKKTCEEMGSAGRQRALAEFQEEIYVDRFLDLYRKMAAHSDRVDTHGSRRTWSGSGGFKTESMSIERLLNYGESA